MDNIDIIFEIQKRIDEVIKYDDLEWSDAGCFLQQSGGEMWRDNAGQYKGSEEEFSFSFSNKGNLTGEPPAQHKEEVLAILEDYR